MSVGLSLLQRISLMEAGAPQGGGRNCLLSIHTNLFPHVVMRTKAPAWFDIATNSLWLTITRPQVKVLVIFYFKPSDKWFRLLSSKFSPSIMQHWKKTPTVWMFLDYLVNPLRFSFDTSFRPSTQAFRQAFYPHLSHRRSSQIAAFWRAHCEYTREKCQLR